LAVAVLGLAAGRPASAATMTFDVHFGATNFESFFWPGQTPPVPFVLGGFHLTLDPTVASSGRVYFDYFNLTLDSLIYYEFDPTGSTKLLIGGGADGIGAVDFEGLNITNKDFRMQITGLNTVGIAVVDFIYTDPAQVLMFRNPANTTVFATSVAATPIPAALPLFAAALGGLGFMGWRRRKAAA
jgi:hypothetical protein